VVPPVTQTGVAWRTHESTNGHQVAMRYLVKVSLSLLSSRY